MGTKEKVFLSKLGNVDEFFPNLPRDTIAVTSDENADYNCIAYVVDDEENWWEPFRTWPDCLPYDDTVAAYEAALSTCGFIRCDADDCLDGYLRIALFAKDGSAMHAARMQDSGRWRSKIGILEDIEHDLRDLEGGDYGDVVLYLQKPL